MSPEIPFDFQAALSHLKFGDCVARRGWNGTGMWLELQTPDEHSKMSQPYIFITTAQGDRVPWLPSSGDLMAVDWFVVE